MRQPISVARWLHRRSRRASPYFKYRFWNEEEMPKAASRMAWCPRRCYSSNEPSQYLLRPTAVHAEDQPEHRGHYGLARRYAFVLQVSATTSSTVSRIGRHPFGHLD